jgi:hypothetical protein
MKDYFKRLKEHPGLEFAWFLTVFSFLAGATNKTAEWYVGGLFGLVLCGGFAWSCVLLSNMKPKEKKHSHSIRKGWKYKPRKEVQKLKLLHHIQTDKANYFIYNIKCLEGTNVSVWIERDGVNILQEEVFEESWGTMGGDSFSSFVISCLNVLRDHIKHNGEFIIKDEMIKNDQQQQHSISND